MRITAKGQVTIPGRIREKAGLLPNTVRYFEFDGRTVSIFERDTKESRGAHRCPSARERRYRDNGYRRATRG